MKKVKMNAKLFVAVIAMAGLSLTSCEKEDFTVDVPNIEIPNVDVEFPEYPDGAIFVQLTASSNKGELLDGVSYTNAAGEAVEELIVVKEATTLDITAKKDGYLPSTKKINVPVPVKGTMMTLPINFVLAEIDPEESTNEPEIQGKPEEVAPVEDKQTAPEPAEGWQPNEEYTAVVKVPAGNHYMTNEQKQELYNEIDNNLKIEGATRAASADEEIAKANLKAQVKDFASQPAKGDMTVKFKLSESAESVNFEISTVNYKQVARFSTTVNDVTYYVDGSYSYCGMSTVTTKADGETIGHGHGHGDNENAGGGTGGK